MGEMKTPKSQMLLHARPMDKFLSLIPFIIFSPSFQISIFFAHSTLFTFFLMFTLSPYSQLRTPGSHCTELISAELSKA